MNRGDIYMAELPSGRRPAVITTRDHAIPLLTNVTVASVTTRVRGLATEAPVGHSNGLRFDSVINCDSLMTIPKSALQRRTGELNPEQLFRFDVALKIALGLD